MSRSCYRFLSVFTVLSVFAVSQADITFFDVFKDVQYSQTSSLQPTTPFSWDFGARMFSNADGDVTQANVNTPGGSITLTPGDPRQVDFFDFGFASEALRDASYSAGQYDYSITAGNLVGETGSLTVPTTVYSNEVPFLTGGSFNALQNATAGNAVSVTWDPYTLGAAVTHQFIYFELRDLTLNSLVLIQRGDNGTYNSQLIDGSLLLGGHNYLWSLFYDPRFEVSNAGFGTATSVVGFDRVTSAQFTVAAVPEPTSLIVVGLGALGILKRRKRA